MHNLNITYNAQENIVLITKEGTISLAEAKLTLAKLAEQYGQCKTLYILEDSRNSKFKISLLETREFLKEIRKKLNGKLEIRHADLFDTPIETAIGIIFQYMVAPIPNYDYRCFSTEKAAIAWLKEGKHYSSN